MLKIVGIGGGSGLPALLKGLKEHSEYQESELSMAAVVCVSDDGGSSGALRRALGIPAVGDLRNCLVALSPGDSVFAELFQYRFGAPGGDLAGHSLGNLIMAAMCDVAGGLGKATERLSRLLRLHGRVYPATEYASTLCAEFGDGEVIRGESRITAAGKAIRRVWLEPDNQPATAGALQAIENADAIVLGPGSLFTSVIPCLLVPGLAEAVRRSPALKIFACNMMTQPGETDGLSAAEHLRVLDSYLGPHAADICLLNSRPLEGELAHRYMQAGSRVVSWNHDEIARMGVVPVAVDLLARSETHVRHSPSKLVRIVVSLTRGALRVRHIVRGQMDLVA